MSALDSLQSQWRANRRLRYAVGIAALFIVLHMAFAMGDSRALGVQQYRSNQALLLRLEGAAADASWLTRADEAAAALDALESTMPEAAGAAEAQAELQALLQTMAAQSGVIQPRIRAETALDVATLPDLRQVVARLDGGLASEGMVKLLKALAAKPWVRVERIELRDGSPGQLQMVVRAYYRRPREAQE